MIKSKKYFKLKPQSTYLDKSFCEFSEYAQLFKDYIHL